jgi:hypothetical protein
MNLKTVDEVEKAAIGLLGAIAAFKVCSSRSSSATIREQLKAIEDLRVEARRELIEFDKSLKITNE